jgi:acyl carrier protein
VAPRNATEELVAGVWAEALGVARVGAGDDFFALGGHSLLATQVLSRLEERFAVEMPLRSLFEAPTVEGLSRRIIQAQTEQVSASELADMLEELEQFSGD